MSKLIDNHWSQQSSSEFDYLLKLSRVGLILPSMDLKQYVSKSFAKLDTARNIILKSTSPERDASESALITNTCAQSFLHKQHTVKIKFIKVRLDWTRSNAKRRLATFANLREWSITSLAKVANLRESSRVVANLRDWSLHRLF